jgi:hypothetical protein
MQKCPQCSSCDIASVAPPPGFDKYFLSAFNSSANTIDPSQGLPVDVYGCTSCKAIFFKNENLKKQ